MKKKKKKAPNIYEKRFYKLMRLIKIDRMLREAKIEHAKSK